ncbi:uncharacterized protein K441DRAFT_460646, partial [Cenococcum geophilum 1.58]|uniref:uncharacterized protein n=1 Tax=Cenococcum geophilum 1.58 TaxID=794803 RepID=UPI00358F03F7
DRWSGYKVLINFLDELFNTKKLAIIKLDKPHLYISQYNPNYFYLLPFVKLVSLECFKLWR